MTKTRLRSPFSPMLALTALVSTGVGISCSEETAGVDDDSGSATGGNGIVVDGSMPGTGGGDAKPPLDGGRIDLTPEQVDEILGAACVGWSAEGKSLPAVLQLVVDESGSMFYPSSGDPNDLDPSKWQITREALSGALAELPPSVSLGMLLYPNRPTNTSPDTPSPIDICVNTDAAVPIAALGEEGSAHRTLREDTFDQALVDSLTPTHDAYGYALENLLIPYVTSSQKFMLLITDGAPTLVQGCLGGWEPVEDQPTPPIVADVKAAFDEHQIRSFIIDSPGSEKSSGDGGDKHPWLSEAASSGGTAKDGCDVAGPNFCHLDMTQEPDFAEALREGLASIVGEIIDSCTFQVPDPPEGETISPNETNLVVQWGDGTSSLILPDEVGDCSDGWQFGDDASIVLCAATCDAVKLDAKAKVDLSFGCKTDEIVDVVR